MDTIIVGIGCSLCIQKRSRWNANVPSAVVSEFPSLLCWTRPTQKKQNCETSSPILVVQFGLNVSEWNNRNKIIKICHQAMKRWEGWRTGCCVRVIIMTDVVCSPFPSHHLFCGGGELTTLSLCYSWLRRSHAKPCYNLAFFCKHLCGPQLLSFLPPLLLIWFLSSLSALFLLSIPFVWVADVLRLSMRPSRLDTGETFVWCTVFYMDGEQWVGCYHPALFLLKGLRLLTHTGADVRMRRTHTHTAQLFVEKHLPVEIMQQCMKTDA